MTTKTVLLAGASGVFGRAVRRALTGAGYTVLGLGRGADNEVRADLLDRAGLLAAVQGVRAEVVVHAATALKKPPARHPDLYRTDDLRTTGTANLLAAVAVVGARRWVGENIAFGYGYRDFGDRVLTEDEPFGPSGVSGAPGDGEFDRHVGAMREKEDLPLAVPGLEAVSLRFGFFYGGEASGGLVEPLRRRRLPTFDDHGHTLPWVHLSDAAGAVVAAIERGRPGAAYNVADDTALGLGGMIREVAAAYRTPRPLSVPRVLFRPVAPLLYRMTGMTLRVSSQRARDELGWRPRYTTLVDGVRADAGVHG